MGNPGPRDLGHLRHPWAAVRLAGRSRETRLRVARL